VPWSIVPITLAVLGAVVPLVGSNYTVWGLVLAWLAGVTVVTIARAVSHLTPPNRVFVDFVLLAMTATVLLPVGGWWFVPAIVAQTVLDRRAPDRTPPVT
jgi:hypothetical protein